MRLFFFSYLTAFACIFQPFKEDRGSPSLVCLPKLAISFSTTAITGSMIEPQTDKDAEERVIVTRKTAYKV